MASDHWLLTLHFHPYEHCGSTSTKHRLHYIFHDCHTFVVPFTVPQEKSQFTQESKFAQKKLDVAVILYSCGRHRVVYQPVLCQLDFCLLFSKPVVLIVTTSTRRCYTEKTSIHTTPTHSTCSLHCDGAVLVSRHIYMYLHIASICQEGT